LLVNPELLRAFAAQVDTASASIRSADVGHKATTAADGIPGSTTQWAMRVVGEHMTQKANDIAKNITDLGVAVRGAGDKYEVEDSTLAAGAALTFTPARVESRVAFTRRVGAECRRAIGVHRGTQPRRRL
jgi:hypothetical protein